MDENIFRITPDTERARDLFEMAKERIEIVNELSRKFPYKIIEEYYEIILELITALMYKDGFKTLSHISAIEYLSKNYKMEESEVKTIEEMRKLRHGIVYYGKRVKEAYLINNEQKIKKIICKLLEIFNQSKSL